MLSLAGAAGWFTRRTMHSASTISPTGQLGVKCGHQCNHNGTTPGNYTPDEEPAVQTMVLEISVPRLLLTRALGRVWRGAYFAPNSPLAPGSRPNAGFPLSIVVDGSMATPIFATSTSCCRGLAVVGRFCRG